MVENLPSNSRDMGSIPGQGTKIPPAQEKLSHTIAEESACVKDHA